MTFSLDPDAARYLESADNRSAVVSEAIRRFRDSELERQLEAAYAEDREESSALAAEWQTADAPLDDSER